MPKTSHLIGKDKPRVVTAGYQLVPVPVASATLGHPVSMRLTLLGEYIRCSVTCLTDIPLSSHSRRMTVANSRQADGRAVLNQLDRFPSHGS